MKPESLISIAKMMLEKGFSEDEIADILKE